MEQDLFEEAAKKWIENQSDFRKRTITIGNRSSDQPWMVTLTIEKEISNIWTDDRIIAAGRGTNLLNAFNDAYNKLRNMVS